MKKQRIFIRFLLGWHMLIAGFALLFYTVRIENQKLAGDLFSQYEKQFLESLKWYDKFDWFGKSLIIIAVVAILSSFFPVVKKPWGRIISIVLGVLLLLFGIILFIDNFGSTINPNPSLIERIVDYFRFMGASGSIIDLVCIIYGILVIIYFTRKTVKNCLSASATSGKQDNIK
jgi:glucan phosphoethanolaminetransferase (alkaline phosphatase superfamily)